MNVSRKVPVNLYAPRNSRVESWARDSDKATITCQLHHPTRPRQRVVSFRPNLVWPEVPDGYMRRRNFIAAISGAATGPLCARATASDRVPPPSSAEGYRNPLRGRGELVTGVRGKSGF